MRSPDTDTVCESTVFNPQDRGKRLHLMLLLLTFCTLQSRTSSASPYSPYPWNSSQWSPRRSPRRSLSSVFAHPISTPHFGACYDGSTYHCTLSPSSCTDSQTYLPPHTLSNYHASTIYGNTLCHDPNRVPVGRCGETDASKHQDPDESFLCAASAASCAVPSKYTPAVTTDRTHRSTDCTVVSGAVVASSRALEELTRYPRCRTPPQHSPTGRGLDRCVVDSRECGSLEIFLPIQSLASPSSDSSTATSSSPPCHCQQVLTGLCYHRIVDPPTIASTFCAVGPYDCPDGYTYLTARQLAATPDAPRMCALCREGDVEEEAVGGVKALRHERIVDAGACYNGTTTDNENDNQQRTWKCVLEKKDCDALGNHWLYRSSREVRENGHIPCRSEEVTGVVCLKGAGDGGGGSAGEGANHQKGGMCVARPESCPNPDQIFTRDGCTVHSDLYLAGDESIVGEEVGDDDSVAVGGPKPAYFGRCRSLASPEQYRCVWGEEECLDGQEIWEIPKRRDEPEDRCRCEHVQTGACIDDNDGTRYCAVSEGACKEGDRFVKGRELLSKEGMECRLCQVKKREPPLGSLLPLDDEQVDIPKEKNILAYLLLGGIGGCLFFTSLGVYYYISKKNRFFLKDLDDFYVDDDEMLDHTVAVE